jgi:hypothetical protein
MMGGLVIKPKEAIAKPRILAQTQEGDTDLG